MSETLTNFQHLQLPNGLDVLAETDAAAQSVALGVMVKTGSRDEPEALNGVSHFLEHMLFKGTATRTAQQINNAFDDLGARNNAFTTSELTCYWAHVLPEYAQPALRLLLDLLAPALRESDFTMEKNVILEEIAQYQDRPGQLLFEAAMRDFFGPHPLALPVLGTSRTVSEMACGTMRSYFDAHYGPGNMAITLAGNFQTEQLFSIIADHLAARTPLAVARNYALPVHKAKRRHIRDAKLNRHYIAMLCPGPTAQDEDRYAAMVLADVLGDLEGSRLFWALIEPGLADEVEFAFMPHDRAGAFLVYASCDPARAAQVEEILLAQLRQVISSGLTEEEVRRSKNKIETGVVLQGESPLGRMRNTASRWIYNHEYRTLADDLAILEAITRQSLETTARGFGFSPLTITTLGPATA